MNTLNLRERFTTNVCRIECLEKVRIALSAECNFKCIYCRPAGDGLVESVNSNNVLTSQDVLDIALLFERLGSKSLNLTGGEPTLRSDISYIIHILLLNTRLNVTLNSNGYSMIEPIDVQLLTQGRLKVVLSMDTCDMESSRAIGRPGAPTTVGYALKYYADLGITTRINTVLIHGFNDNPESINNLLDFSIAQRSNLKVQTVFSVGNARYIKSNLIETSLLTVENELHRRGYEIKNIKNQASGVPEVVWHKGEHSVYLLAKCHELTKYVPACRSCEYYPCDSGIFAHFVSSTGTLQFCRMGHESVVNLKQVLRMPVEVQAVYMYWLFQRIYNYA